MERTVNTSNSHAAGFEPAQIWHPVLGDDAFSRAVKDGAVKDGAVKDGAVKDGDV